MNDKILEMLENRNKLGKVKLEENKLEYSKQILMCIRENPEILNFIEQQMQIPKEEIIDKFSSNETNISLLDQTLTLVKKRTNPNKIINKD